MIGILRGSFMFLADLVRDLYRQEVRPRIDFITLESYGSGTESSGIVRVTKDINMQLKARAVGIEFPELCARIIELSLAARS